MILQRPIKHIVLDRDGTVIEDRHYLSDPEGVALIPGAGRALGELAAAGLGLYLATNQSGIGRGYFEEKDYLGVQERLSRLLAPYGACFLDVAYCPHAPGDGCDCRKPGPGLWRDLAQANGLDPAETAMIGDMASDVSFGLEAGLGLVVLVLTGQGREEAERLGLPRPDESRAEPFMELAERRPGWPHALARDLAAAARLILERNAARERP